MMKMSHLTLQKTIEVFQYPSQMIAKRILFGFQKPTMLKVCWEESGHQQKVVQKYCLVTNKQ